MKYLAFGYIFSIPHGGMEDLKGSYDTPELARERVEQCAKKDNLRDCTYCGQIVRAENETLTIISLYRAVSSRDGIIDWQEWVDKN